MSLGSLKYSLSLATGGFTGPLRGAMRAAKGATGTLSSLGNVATGLASLPQAFGNLLAPLQQPITLAADMEALHTSFKTLLRDGAAAKSLVSDLMKFADVTPFDPVPVARTGKQLLAFGFQARQVKPLLKDIGDLAAGMEKPIEDVGSAFGRLNAGDFGEAFERMRDFGISRADLEGVGLKFDRSGSFQGSAEQALEGVRRIIRRKFGGGMADLSQTFKGVMSNLQAAWDKIQVSFGQPIMKAIEPIIEQGTEALKKWEPEAKKVGEAIAKGITVVRQLFVSGELWEAARLGLTIAGKELVNLLHSGLQGMVAALTAGLAGAAGVFQSLMGESGLWEGIGKMLNSQVMSLRAALLDTVADVVESLPAFLGGGKHQISSADAAIIKNLEDNKSKLFAQREQAAAKGLNTSRLDALIALRDQQIAEKQGLRGKAEASNRMASELSLDAAALIGSLDIKGLVEEMGKAASDTGSAFQQGVADSLPPMPIGNDIANLNAIMARVESFMSKSNTDTRTQKDLLNNMKAMVKHADGIVGNLQRIETKLEDSLSTRGAFAT